jgi:uncharacterized protein YydD (DUF2326 family)
MLQKVENHENLLKDSESGAILLSNRNVADEYKARKKLLNHNRSLETEINMIKQELEELNAIRDSVNEIKELLKGLASK